MWRESRAEFERARVVEPRAHNAGSTYKQVVSHYKHSTIPTSITRFDKGLYCFGADY